MNDNGKMSISQLAKRYGRDRGTIRSLVKDLPFSTGPRGSHLYDADLARAAIQTVASNREGIVSEKLRQLKAQNALLEIELAKQRGDYIHRQEVYDVLANIFLAIRSKIVGSHLSESEQDAILLDLAGLKDAEF